jgi:23S rRNA (cytidine1920-2'-O)/16S rRNA (cytidine1409-2'-O)-methyltransferase
VGYGQLHPRLRDDPRVVVMERTNARYLGRLPEPVDLATVDVSFISLTKVLPAVAANLRPGGSIVALFKPQFEAHRGEVPRKGVIRDPLLHATLIGRFVAWATGQGYRVLGPVRSPLPGAEGNLEFFFLLRPHA